MAQYVYGKNVVMQMLKNQSEIQQLYLLEKSNQKEIEELARKNQVMIQYVNRNRLDTLVKTSKHQGIVAQIKEYRTYSLDEILNAIPSGKQPLLVMLDGLEDPHNLGAILRTCDCVGVDGVIIGKHRSVSLNATVAKVSTGAIDTVKVAQVTNLTQTLKELKEKGFWVCGADGYEAQDYRAIDYNVPLVLVVGSEGFGISRLVKKECDYCVSIPMVGTVSSLNASIATAVLLYQVYSQRFPFK
ncbi:MAG: 23S rRNA (guanosine(2251)-2'-O)-methyltransferase RlmB [Erysipelotrichaceae bacterium]|nr:23S rRNA (guanosine(2251)-2'-O)-methyltransferase RlmB [Erysipelotrichaceae bacterium]